MSDYTITTAAEVPDVLGDYPGEMRMLTGALDSEQVAFMVRRMPPQKGGTDPRADAVKHEGFWPA
jgi:hypothetical protein